ncbi:MAG: Ig-like domain-containing protein [Gemmatimonadota bacterium]
MPLLRRFTFLSLCSLLAGSTLALTGCDEGPTGPTHFTILSPGEGRVTVLPGDTVHFQVQLNATGFRVEYLVDGEKVHEGPAFDFAPILVEHTVRISVVPIGSTAEPDIRDFLVGVEVPGNAPPAVSSFDHVPETAEAVTDTFLINLTASDTDGSVSRVVLDFSDGTDPVTLTGDGLAGSQIQTEHVFPAQGTYEIEALIFDDDGVAVAVRDTVIAQPPNQFPTGTLTVVGNSEGDAPIVVSLRTSGNDVDGQIVEWELDTGLGEGFQPIQPNQTVQVTYPFSNDAYRPVLRLTDDDGDSSLIEADQEILVFRQIDASQSDVTFQANPAFANVPIAPAIWADGQDAFVVTVDVRAPDGSPLADAPVSVKATRPELFAPDGQNLGVPVTILPADPRTDGQGQVTIFVRTNTSTRVEAVPDISFEPFDIEILADRGHGATVPLRTFKGLNAETIIGSATGSLSIRAADGQGGYCPGEMVNISVGVTARGGAPGAGGPAANRYVEVRRGQFSNPALIPTTPGPGFSSWRTNGSGEIVLQSRPQAEDQAVIVIAWVDGQPLDDLKSFNFAANCP